MWCAARSRTTCLRGAVRRPGSRSCSSSARSGCSRCSCCSRPGSCSTAASFDTDHYAIWTGLGIAGSTALVLALPLARRLAPHLPAHDRRASPARVPELSSWGAFALTRRAVARHPGAGHARRLGAAARARAGDRPRASRCSSSRSPRRRRSSRSPSVAPARANSSTSHSAGCCFHLTRQTRWLPRWRCGWRTWRSGASAG